MDSSSKSIKRNISINIKIEYLLKKTSSNYEIFTSNIIRLIRCKKINTVI